MVELSIVGDRNSGKTTLVEALVSRLAGLNYKVATIKHTAHNHLFDQPGKDSYRHRRAGAGMTLAISGSELAFFADVTKAYKQDLMNVMAARFDICLVEGDRTADCPKVLLTRNRKPDASELPANIVAVYGPELDDLKIPRYELDDIDGLVEFIVGRFLAPTAEGADA
jgi:molybdopterin-guanine dinucleotide biosynthesis protein MobB